MLLHSFRPGGTQTEVDVHERMWRIKDSLGMTPEHLIHLCIAAGTNARSITTTSRSADESPERMAHDMRKEVSTLNS